MHRCFSQYKKPLRIAECNTFFNGGLKGGSDVFAAALVRPQMKSVPAAARDVCVHAMLCTVPRFSLRCPVPREQWALDFMIGTANAGVVGTDFHGFETT